MGRKFYGKLKGKVNPKIGPFEFGSAEHHDCLKRHEDSKWRGNYTVGICLKTCANRGNHCYVCFKFSQYKAKE